MMEGRVEADYSNTEFISDEPMVPNGMTGDIIGENEDGKLQVRWDNGKSISIRKMWAKPVPRT